MYVLLYWIVSLSLSTLLSSFVVKTLSIEKADNYVSCCLLFYPSMSSGHPLTAYGLSTRSTLSLVHRTGERNSASLIPRLSSFVWHFVWPPSQAESLGSEASFLLLLDTGTY